MKTYTTTPQTEEGKTFFSRYAGLVPTLFKIGILAQIISFVTEIGGINAVIESTLSDFDPVLAASVSILGAIIGAGLLEIGLRKFVPYAIRQVLYERWDTKEDAWMTVFIIFCSCLLIAGSGVLSFNNSKNMVREYMPPPELKTTDQAKGNFEDTRLQAYEDFRIDSTEIANRYASQISAIKSSYKSKVTAKWQEYHKWRDRETANIKYTTKKNNIKIQVRELEAERDQKIATLEAERAQELHDIADNKKATIKEASSELAVAKDSIDNYNSIAVMGTQSNIKNYGGGLAYFTIFCLIVFIISVVLNEIHKKGSGIEEVVEPGSFYHAPSIFNEFGFAINDRLQYGLRRAIANKFSYEKRDDILPKYGRELYDYSGLVRPVRKLSDEADEPLTAPQKTIVGYNRKASPDESLTTQDDRSLTDADKSSLTDDEKTRQLLSDNSSERFGDDLSAIEVFDADKAPKVRLEGAVYGDLSGRTYDLSATKDLADFKSAARQWYHRQHVSATSQARTENRIKWENAQKVLNHFGIQYWKSGNDKITYKNPNDKKL